MVKYLGDQPLDIYFTADAASLRDWLFERQLTYTSIQPIFSTIRAAINLPIYEDGLNARNAFSKTYLPSEARTKRTPIPPEDIKRVQKFFLDIADERRLILALISDKE